MESRQKILDLINHATGTTQYHRFSNLWGYPIITDGVKAVAEAAGCYWLLDIIGSYQHSPKLDRAFQVWTLAANHEDTTAVVRGYNDTTLIITQKIQFTDFPLDELKMYLIDGVILLPSEY